MTILHNSRLDEASRFGGLAFHAFLTLNWGTVEEGRGMALLSVRRATEADYRQISVLVVHTFEQNTEHRLIENLRRSGAVALELVAQKSNRIVGHICFSKFEVPKGWWALAPVCVSNDHQNSGIGGELIRHGLDIARRERAKAIVVLGNPDYYRRFGFVFDGPARLTTPYPVQYTGLYPIAPETAAAQVALRYPAAFEEM